MNGESLDAGTLVGLLADEDRRRVVAALVLGAATVDDVARQAGLDLPRAGKALARLVDGGLVERGDDGTLALLGQAFAHAARAAAVQREPDEVGEGVPPEAAKVLRSFVRDGRLVSIPASHSKRLVVLDRLAQEFEPGRRYSEKMVNLILGKWNADTASLRRYLVDDGFLEREAGEYWRAGGSVSLDQQP